MNFRQDMSFTLKLSETLFDEFMEELEDINSEKNKLYKLIEVACGRLSMLHVGCWMMANNDKKISNSGQFKTHVKTLDAFICECDEKDWDDIIVEPKVLHSLMVVGCWLYDEDGLMNRIFNSFMEFESKEKFNSSNKLQLKSVFNTFKNTAISKYKQSEIFKSTKVEAAGLNLVKEGA